ncbi:MAG: hypothetical protein OEW00_03225 [candidate division Zixibacteria bacterium]|nr:hypothetical protein [candidate division Zixibacteria bacterium]
MRYKARNGLLVVLTMLLAAPAVDAGIQKVSRRMTMIDFYAGGSIISGKYEGLGLDHWNDLFDVGFASPSIGGSDIYKSTYHFGIDYGQLRNDHILFTIGFRYTRVQVKDSINIPFNDPEYDYALMDFDDIFNVHLYDIDFNLNYFVTNAQRSLLAPYVGLGFKGGFMSFATDARDLESGLEYADENELKFTVSVNFGADIKVWTAPSGRSYFTLSSVNSWDLLASGQRPRYLNIGGAIKYYFRP